MLLQRLSRHVREQNWFAVALGFVIVITGVVLGFQITAWNEDRREDAREQLIIDRLARDNTTRSDPGSLAGSVSRYEAQVERNSDKLDRIAEQQENLRERLTRDLVAAERRISASQSTLSFLEQQIEAWNGSN